MLHKTQRLSTEIFKEVIEKGQAFHSPFLLLRAILSQGESRFAVSVPKRVSKTAVGRNRLRRQAYSIVGQMKARIEEGFLVVMVCKPGAEKLKVDNLREEIEKIFVKSGVIK